MKSTDTPGLARTGGSLYWRCSPRAYEAGYPDRRIRLTHLAADPERLAAECQRLRDREKAWLAGKPVDSGNEQPMSPEMVKKQIHHWFKFGAKARSGAKCP